MTVAPSAPTLGHYRLDAELGRGGMGVVFRALDLRLGRPVALKVVHRSVAEAAGLSLADLQARLKHEAQLAARILHPNVVTVFAYDEVGDDALIAMELVEGQTLADLLARGHRWAPLDVARLLVQVADGVAAAHALGIVHRDLKPANLILTNDGRCKVLDFGIAKATSSDFAPAVSRTTFGTVQYMAPEQVLGRPVSAATDVWALGAIAYELTVGVPAFGDGAAVTIGMRVAGEEPPYLTDPALAEQIFGRLTPVVQLALRKRPEERYPHAAAFRDALAGMVHHGAPGSVSPVSNAGAFAASTLAASAGAASAGVVGDAAVASPSGRQEFPPPIHDAPPAGAQAGASNAAPQRTDDAVTPATTGGGVVAPSTGERKPPPTAQRAAVALIAVLVVFGAAAGAYLFSGPEPVVAKAASGGNAETVASMPASAQSASADPALSADNAPVALPAPAVASPDSRTAAGTGSPERPGSAEASQDRDRATSSSDPAAGGARAQAATATPAPPPSPTSIGPTESTQAGNVPARRSPPRVMIEPGQRQLGLDIGEMKQVAWRYEFQPTEPMRVDWRVESGGGVAAADGDGSFRAIAPGTSRFVAVTIGPNGEETGGDAISVMVRERTVPATAVAPATSSPGPAPGVRSPVPVPVDAAAIQEVIAQAVSKVPAEGQQWPGLNGFIAPDLKVKGVTFHQRARGGAVNVRSTDSNGRTPFDAKVILEYEAGFGGERERILSLRGSAVTEAGKRAPSLRIDGYGIGPVYDPKKQKPGS